MRPLSRSAPIPTKIRASLPTPHAMSDFDPELTALKLPPHSVEAEQSVLGGLLLENHAWERVADLINEQDFYRADHRHIWQRIVRLIDENKPADVVTVAEALESHNRLDDVGGLAYLAALAQNTPSAANIRRYAEIVRERSVLRKLVEVGGEISTAAFNPNGRSATDILDEAEKKVFDIKEAGAKASQGFQPLQPLLKEVVTRIDELYNRDNPSEVTGVATGYSDLDTKTSGLQPGDLIIVAGRPSMGKTAFSLNIAENVALDANLPVAVFSMEMGATQLVMRMLGSVGRLDQHKLRTGRITDDDWPRLTHALGSLNEAKMFIDESPGLTAMEVRARARRLARQCEGGQLGLIVLDYLQLMSGNGQGENLRHLPLPQEPGQGTARAGDRPVATQPLPGTAPQQAPGDVRPARIRRHRAGCRLDPVHLPRRGLQPGHPGQGHGGNHHRKAAQRPHRHGATDLPGRIHPLREFRDGGDVDTRHKEKRRPLATLPLAPCPRI
jgi:replicative DNA helicase